MQGKARPNCIDYRAASLSVVTLPLGIPSLGCVNRLSTNRGLWCSWGTATMWDSFIFSPNNLIVSAADKRMLNSSCPRCRISPRVNYVIPDVHADTWVPFVLVCSRARCVQSSPVCTGMPSSTYFRSRVAAVCCTASDSAQRVTCCLETVKAVREGSCVSASRFSCAVVTRL